MYRIRTTPTFDKDIKKLDRQVAKRIIKKIEWIISQSKIPTSLIRYLPKDLEGLQKYRIGDWRILFWIDRKKKEIILYEVRHRKDIYKKF